MATQESMDPRMAEFMARIDRGEKIEADDWMPDDYRQELIRLITMHGISEVMGALPEKEWVPKAPTLQRKLAIMAKVQDEMGHGQLLLRVAEDLVAPLGKTRENFIADLLAGKQRFHNVFHMESPTWADAGVIAWLVDGAAIVTQTSLMNTSYGPYSRTLNRIVPEEVFHAQHGEAIIIALAEGTPAQRQQLQESVNHWWPALMMFFGPQETNQGSSHQQRNMRYKIRSMLNEELRQIFLNKYVPRIWSLGLTVPDETIRYDQQQQRWIYREPDWALFKRIINNDGPKSQERINLRKMSYEDAEWVREVLSGGQRAIS